MLCPRGQTGRRVGTRGKQMITFFIGLTLGTSFGFLIGAIMTDAKFADERVEGEQEEAADRLRY